MVRALEHGLTEHPRLAPLFTGSLAYLKGLVGAERASYQANLDNEAIAYVNEGSNVVATWTGPVSAGVANAVQVATGKKTPGQALTDTATQIALVKGTGAVAQFGGKALSILSGVLAKVGRAGKQARLRELVHDPKVSSADRGWLLQEINSIARGQRKNIRVPPGKELAHRRGFEAKKGFSYKHSDLQDVNLHKLQHRHEGY